MPNLFLLAAGCRVLPCSRARGEETVEGCGAGGRDSGGLSKIVSGKFPDVVDKDKVRGAVKKNQDRVKARRRYYVVFCGLARGNVTACRTYFCLLPAVAFSRALEREEKRRLKAAEPEDVTAAVFVGSK
ncbi:hypothetical protein NDU88_004072 [Pleurodeles waltl]|uniref:Uncharacterized protein n=1 Tax=Pleurodeles waltl TaxID=8319 RepID=A0AAV7SHX2_PLEWA|nr:hypothetical protein NDU88_004072 [Pleurodeles waltl]